VVRHGNKMDLNIQLLIEFPFIDIGIFKQTIFEANGVKKQM